ncbi:MAG: BrxA/BrxB family bacilliredoxin [Chitinophagales bacterium]|nr:BrxA/BrxB family bacilliredoxin [Chitinophagales bacterium]MCB9019337.1 BrxA/BrxB family bacilliredoxin [Chitinophagales bacterium]MCB9020588.1 BrxA/BrxB family bacilliredoxin [Chitinophagales bacterium]MCB9031459.1 BrxA/BrxB family bacilliredoxin [Chitinophagales bacterium]HPE98851.1 BrxA/BrxB family bacilliredoxin [Chitinophagales bacterium]
MYPPALVMPMKQELTSVGFEDLTTAEEVREAIQDMPGTLLVVINSVCGCAAGYARPGVRLSLQHSKTPDRLATVFAGFDMESVAEVRKLTLPYPPSSPSMALFKDGKLVHFIERHQIEGHNAAMVAENLMKAYDKHC